MNFMDMFKDNPFMNMCKDGMCKDNNPFAKSMEMWQKMFNAKNCDASQMLSKWTEFCQMCKCKEADQNNFASSGVKGVESALEVSKTISKNAEEIMKEKGRILQENADKIFNLMKEIWESPTPEASMSKQAEFSKAAFEKILADFKHLTEMYSKSNMETFEILSGKLQENIKDYPKETMKSAKKTTA